MEERVTNYKTDQNKTQSFGWLLSAFGSLVGLGFGGFICGINSSKPIGVYIGSSQAQLFVSILLFIYFTIQKRRKLQRPLKCSDLSILEQTEQGIHIKSGFWACIIGGIFNGLGQLFIFVGFYEDPENRGVLICISAGQAITSAILVYLIYKEKLDIYQIIGMLVAFGGLCLICLQDVQAGTITGFLCGLVNVLSFTGRNIASKQARINQIDSFTVFIIYCVTQGIQGWIFTAIFSYTMEQPPLDDPLLYVGFLGGLLLAIGVLMLNYSIMNGVVGPVTTIANMAGVLQVFLDFVLLSILPNYMKVLGCFIAILGVTIMVIQDFFKLCKKVS